MIKYISLKNFILKSQIQMSIEINSLSINATTSYYKFHNNSKYGRLFLKNIYFLPPCGYMYYYMFFISGKTGQDRTRLDNTLQWQISNVIHSDFE